MNYIGSKVSLLGFIDRVFSGIADGSEKVFCDIFAGTGAVGRHFKERGLRVIANDIQVYAYVLNKAYLEINEPPAFRGLPGIGDAVLDYLNGLSGKPGFVTRHYSPDGGRMYYTLDNAQRVDAIRQRLETWRRNRRISSPEYHYLLCSLLEAVDQVANTASVYGAFLKKFKTSARRRFQMKPLRLINHVKGCVVHNTDANELIRRITCDVLYLDPPYNHRQYGANYHVLETIAAYDRPAVSGVSGLRPYYRSDYCRRDAVAEAFRGLISAARAKHILVSYNDEGVLPIRDLREILGTRGPVKTFETAHSRFKADNGRVYSREGTVESIHWVRVER